MAETSLIATGHYGLYTGQHMIARLAAPGVEGYVLGRTDAGSPYVPDIDLAEYQALEHGVSRRHAVLVRFQEYICLVDLHSVNGTFVNGKRLQPEKPCRLSAADTLQLGTFNFSLIKIK